MLQANKAQLLTQLNLDTLNIRRSELNYWASSFAKLGTLGAVLCGFAANVMMLSVRELNSADSKTLFIDVQTLPHLIFILSTVSAFGCNLLLLTVSTLCW